MHTNSIQITSQIVSSIAANSSGLLDSANANERSRVQLHLRNHVKSASPSQKSAEAKKTHRTEPVFRTNHLGKTKCQKQWCILKHMMIDSSTPKSNTCPLASKVVHNYPRVLVSLQQAIGHWPPRLAPQGLRPFWQIWWIFLDRTNLGTLEFSWQTLAFQRLFFRLQTWDEFIWISTKTTFSIEGIPT